MMVTANEFLKLQSVKILVIYLSLNSAVSEHALTVNMWKRPKCLQISMRALLSCVSSFSLSLIFKNYSLVLGDILGVFVNTLTGDAKYPVQDCENLLLPIQMNSLKNLKLFPNSLFHFWNLHQILNILKKRMIVIANVFPKLQTVEILVRPLSK